MKKKLSQTDMILALMRRRKKGITAKDAYIYAHSMNLPQRIYDLKKRDYKIVDNYVEVTNEFGEKYRVKQYRLVQ